MAWGRKESIAISAYTVCLIDQQLDTSWEIMQEIDRAAPLVRGKVVLVHY